MIDANELRIGNWVSYEVEGETKISQVIPSDFIVLGFDFNIFNPIPLTPELLEKAGFTYNEKRDNWVIEYIRDKNSRVFVVRQDAGDGLGWFCYVHDCVTFDSVSLCLTPSLHIVQNAYYYCSGQELEITL